MRFLRNLDVLVAVVALIIFLVAGLPLGGWITGAGIYFVQRGIAAFTAGRARDSDDARTVVGLMAGSMIGRGWLVALTIFAVGLLAGSDVGLAAAVLFVALFTVYFTTQMIVRPFEKEDRRP